MGISIGFAPLVEGRTLLRMCCTKCSSTQLAWHTQFQRKVQNLLPLSPVSLSLSPMQTLLPPASRVESRLRRYPKRIQSLGTLNFWDVIQFVGSAMFAGIFLTSAILGKHNLSGMTQRCLSWSKLVFGEQKEKGLSLAFPVVTCLDVSQKQLEPSVLQGPVSLFSILQLLNSKATQCYHITCSYILPSLCKPHLIENSSERHL